MRLLDQLVQSDPILHIETQHMREQLEGAGVWKEHLTSCPLRYVLDARTAERCRLLASSDNAMFAGDNEFLRAPASQLWVEWNNPPFPGGLRSGALISSDESGRRGTMELFWEQIDIDPIWAQASVEFDFDTENSSPSDLGDSFALVPNACAIAPHLRFHPQEQWLPMLQVLDSEQLNAAMRNMLRPIVADVELVFAFAALLGEGRTLKTVASDLHRLNRQRSKRRKIALLDHIEVSLDMEAVSRVAIASAEGRSASRLHHVRGHMVHRDQATFWRRSHFRGDASAMVLSRTVSVRSAGV